MEEKLKILLERIIDEEFEMIKAATNFRDLEFWDSLMYVNLVVGIQKEFKVELTKDDIQNLLSVSSIESVLSNHGVK